MPFVPVFSFPLIAISVTLVFIIYCNTPTDTSTSLSSNSIVFNLGYTIKTPGKFLKS